MCGIIGLVGGTNVVPLLLEGLKRLEYRGYDSAGVATLEDRRFTVRKAPGRVSELERLLRRQPIQARSGIAHTRWATHGAPSEANSHPHVAPGLTLVHNGIVENHESLREEVLASGVCPRGETDSEVLAWLVAGRLGQGQAPLEALQHVLARVEGSFAVCLMVAREPGRLYFARRGSALVVSETRPAGCAVASDPLAFPEDVRDYRVIESGDRGYVDAGRIYVESEFGQPVERARRQVPTGEGRAERGKHAHFMHKEIHEQPKTIPRAIEGARQVPDASARLAACHSLTLVACGTSHHAAQIAAEWFEQLVGVPTRAVIASEYRYGCQAERPGELVFGISQSGETADTLAALRGALARGLDTMALVNVAHSTMATLAAQTVLMRAGPEIGVASTKAFTAQLASLLQLALDAARCRSARPAEELDRLEHGLQQIAGDVFVGLALEPQIRALARRVHGAQHLFIIGRGQMASLAKEGALKIKETSYIHAEGFAAGELKHGSIALIEPGTPVIALCPEGDLSEKTLTSAAEVSCRGAQVYFLETRQRDCGPEPTRLSLPAVDELLSPLVLAPALQLLAYHLALESETDVDKPRNLAKSVTVE